MSRSEALRRWLWPLCGVFVTWLILRVLPLPSDGTIAGLPSPCPLYTLAAVPCPLCGFTRSLVCLAHGHFTEAVWWHPLGPALAAIALGWCLLSVRHNLWSRPLPVNGVNRVWWSAVFCIALVWIARLTKWLPSPF